MSNFDLADKQHCFLVPIFVYSLFCLFSSSDLKDSGLLAERIHKKAPIFFYSFPFQLITSPTCHGQTRTPTLKCQTQVALLFFFFKQNVCGR